MPTPSTDPRVVNRILGMCPEGASVIPGACTAPKGFKAAGVAAGIKKKGLDMALLVSDAPCRAAGVFTKNLVCAAPVTLCKGILYGRDPGAEAPTVSAIVTNSGNANACTGEQGMKDAAAMAAAVETALSLPEGSCLVASTGVIGQPLPIDKAIAGIEAAVGALSYDGGPEAARAIMTTDTVPKGIALEVTLPGGTVRIGAMAKGSGMIHPDMATMLGYVTTDAALGLDHEGLRALLRTAADDTFNLITVDNDTSTNDSLFLLANGASGVTIGPGSPGWDTYTEALTFALRYLAMLMAGDGEGASKLVELVIIGSHDRDSLKRVGMSIAHSYLVKTAIFGEDANWGRVIAAAGYAGVPFEPARVDIWIGDLQVCSGGMYLPFDEDAAKAILGEPWIRITVALDGIRDNSMTLWTCDMTHDYVDINGSYRS